MPIESYHRTTCRLCLSPDQNRVLELRPSAIADAFVDVSERQTEQPLFPLDLYQCQSCGHVQLGEVVNPEVLFRHYIYATESSPGLQKHFRAAADQLETNFSSVQDRFAVDIGSNDGTLLRILAEKGFRVLGVDPATAVAQKATASGIETWAEFFTPAVARRIVEQHGKADLVTANNVFAHIDNLGDVVDGIQTLLAPDGVFVFEVGYLPDMITNMVFDWIYHEHLCYHSVRPLTAFFSRHGMELFDVERIPTKGGSFRGKAQLKGGPRPVEVSVALFAQGEEAMGLTDQGTWDAYANRIEARKQALLLVLSEAKAQGKSIAGFGASPTGTTLTYNFEIAPYLEFLCDDNPIRQGLFSPGHHIPVMSRGALRDHRPEIVVILAWRFAQLILNNNQAYLDAGGQFVIPLPEFSIRG